MLNISISSLFNRKVWFCIFIPLILAGCGGGSEEASTGNQQAAAGTDLANEGNSRQKIYSADPSLSTAQAQGLTTNIASSLQPCKLMMFGNSPGYYRCRILAADFYPPQTGDGVGAGPAISQCQTLSVGQAIVASTPRRAKTPRTDPERILVFKLSSALKLQLTLM